MTACLETTYSIQIHKHTKYLSESCAKIKNNTLCLSAKNKFKKQLVHTVYMQVYLFSYNIKCAAFTFSIQYG